MNDTCIEEHAFTGADLEEISCRTGLGQSCGKCVDTATEIIRQCAVSSTESAA
ncbi:MAG: hypothetical protein KDK30_09495 [Leptospiraceae bacterium]|nr:hypothetical protein [Leptospiraceae bacterium]MCB1316190.1 hypothetical protein [Leptospiraceae bacterium]MCB1321451.1 hypothetical protein [Leptospiraceae bacterium]